MSGNSIGFGEEIKKYCKKCDIYACLSGALRIGPCCYNVTDDTSAIVGFPTLKCRRQHDDMLKISHLSWA